MTTAQTTKPYEMIQDYVTGKEVPNVGPEENRQRVERFLVEAKGYVKGDIEVDAPIGFTVGDERFESTVDLVVAVEGKRFMVFKCAAGSLASRQREALAAARLLDTYQVPLCVVTDGRQAAVLDTIAGQVLAEGMDAIPSKAEASRRVEETSFKPFPPEKKEREKIIFRSYDEMNVNVRRRLREA